jgi:hypothetical protein
MQALELAISIEVSGNHAQQRIALSGHDVSLNHRGQLPDRGCKLLDGLRILRNQRYPRKHRQCDAHFGGAQQRCIALDDSLTLQPSYPTQARRRCEPVVALVGDGASLYSPQALWTAARERLPVTFVLMNNRKYGILKTYRQAQEHGASRFTGLDLINPTIDFIALATSMGVIAQRVERAADIAGAVEARVGSDGPSLIEIEICD